VRETDRRERERERERERKKDENTEDLFSGCIFSVIR
jgi:hypothetical protein